MVSKNLDCFHVYVYDEFSPQDIAMMQALYSRSPLSVAVHVDKVRLSGSGKFMEQFYVGYGHSSIADCGSTTIFIENLSILADKAIQDWFQYAGQETSTRYVDMSKQRLVDPVGNKKSSKILQKWMNFYLDNQPKVEQYLCSCYPIKTGQNDAVYIKAIKARSFDILRGFLPAGITTQLSWHTNLRQAWDHLQILTHHPLSEVRQVSTEILRQLKGKYPHSFSHEIVPSQEDYLELFQKEYAYLSVKERWPRFKFKSQINKNELNKFKKILNRPAKTGLPAFLSQLGVLEFRFRLDYGSFREVQRHRSAFHHMPLLTLEYGFNQWYLMQLPSEVRKKAEQLIKEQEEEIQKLKCCKEERQYYIPLGYNVGVKMVCTLPSAVYIAELRSGKAVHPTLRIIAQKMGAEIEKISPNLKLNLDREPSDWDICRGTHDIVRKK